MNEDDTLEEVRIGRNEDLYGSYPVDDVFLPGLGDQYKVFVDPQFADDEKTKIWKYKFNVFNHIGNYAHAFARWVIAQKWIPSEAAESRTVSHDLLLEWWTNEGYDSGVTKSICAWIKQAASHDLDLAIEPRISGSSYNLALFNLWLTEHRRCLRPPYTNQGAGVIEALRQDAAAEAACHRIKSAIMLPLLSTASENPYKTTRTGVPTTIGINPCGWLSHAEKFSTLPYYLWDRRQRCTVITNEIANGPAYMAVSHTWGRWKTDETLQVAGALWLIPGNTQFDVTMLPELLASLSFPERYVWMDLLCIPQTDPEHDHRAKTEIANQAAIFSSARRAIAWLTTVPSWIGLQTSIEYVALQSISQEGQIDVREALSRAIQKADMTTHMVQLASTAESPYPIESDRYTLQPWFTSLWTLQELCLRPDMLLCDNEWRTLELEGFDVPFDHLVSLWFSESRANYLKEYRSEPVHPTGAQEVNLALVKTGLKDLSGMTPMNVLILGDQRYCEDRRAEAIMSVIGCKSWFTESSSLHPSREALVLGRYPYSFVQEVRSKLKGQFFSSLDERRYIAGPLRGTLLPFSAGDSYPQKAWTILPQADRGMKDHPSVETWTVQPGGQVLLRDVCILAPSKDTELFVQILWPYEDHVHLANYETKPSSFTREPDGTVELNRFLSSFWPDRQKFAIILMRCGSFVTGFIVAEVYEQGDHKDCAQDTEQLFAKLYNFWFVGTDREYPTSKLVIWV